MVAVTHEVHAADLENLYRRQRDILVVRQVHPHPAAHQLVMSGQERPVEILVPPFAAYDLRDWDSLHSPVDLRVGPQQRAHVPQGKHFVFLRLEQGEYPPEGLLRPQLAEVIARKGLVHLVAHVVFPRSIMI